MRKLARLLGVLLVFSTIAHALPEPKKGFHWDDFRKLAVQHRGRIKPLDTFAREVAQFITGKTHWQGFEPTELVLSWLITYESTWQNIPFVRVDYGPLKKAVGLSTEERYFPPEKLRENAELKKLIEQAQKKSRAKERLNEEEKKASNVFQQVLLLESIVRGEEMAMLPNPEGLNKDWFPIAALTNPAQYGLPYSNEQGQKVSDGLKVLLNAYSEGKSDVWNASAPEWVKFVRTDLANGAYPTEAAIQREVHYNHFRPFRWAWVWYALSFALLTAAIVSQNVLVCRAGASALVIGFAIHTYGFVLRCLIAGRPPVSNMYESVIWVSWGCVLFSFIIWAAYKNWIIPAAGSVFAAIALVLADNLPNVLDPGIHPLEPVLRSNFWLTIHVLTITLSYAAFALSLCLGNVVLGLFLTKPKASERIQFMSLYMYRAVQIGVILLAAGTILGGVWADYSWGRFWGWDPKEVWALIALLLYLAVLHGRFAGWLRGFGFAAATVLCFLGVLMAWYGVNFVLGVGLHSYGFGSGGMSYVLSYIAAQVGFMVVSYVKYAQARKTGGVDTAIFPKGM